MKVCLVWPGCPMSKGEWNYHPTTAFWVAATEEEVRKFFADKFNDNELQEFEKACQDANYLDGWYRGTRDYSEPRDDLFRVLVTKDMSRADLGFAVYPYSGMWGDGSPFKKFEAEIYSPEELMNLL